jgi:UDP-N-acetylmuramoyl-tripeptide--D-alanyl-D-alanine ligase
MIRFSLTHAAALLGGHYDGPDGEFAAVGSDSRTLLPGSLFVALPGARFDGHDHLAQAAERGALAALVSRPVASPLPQLRVDDTRLALGRLAAAWLAAGRAARPTQVVAVTGSNGKTTVKEMLAAILAQRGPVLATRGNLNNDIGMPLTLLRLQEESFVVAEMGANHAGEIGYLSRLASPDVAVLNNAGRAHLEGFGSLEGVAMAKGEIVDGLGADGLFVFDAASPWAALWRERAAGRRILSFGVDERADLYSPAEEFRLDWRDDGFVSRFPVRGPMGGFEVELALAGVHNRQNALAATAAALGLGLTPEEIRRGLAAVRPVPGRLQPRRGRDGVRLLDDSYNANPDSVGAAITVLAKAPGRRFLLLGELAELGEGVETFYRQLGEQARGAGIEFLFAVGPAAPAAESFGPGGRGFAERQDLLDALVPLLRAGDCVLAKGSRRAGMETLMAALAAPDEG